MGRVRSPWSTSSARDLALALAGWLAAVATLATLTGCQQPHAVVCPGTALQKGARPPVRSLLDRGAPVALGTDHNPGGTGITSMALVISLAVSYLGMSVEEALRAATIGGAHALKATDRGAMVRGRLADMVLWDADHEGAFVWSYGLTPRRVWLGGEPVTN